MNDAQSTIVGLRAQDCPGGGWNGMPADLERATVADCLTNGVCGCIYGDAVQHIERLTEAKASWMRQADKRAIEVADLTVERDRLRATLTRARNHISLVPLSDEAPASDDLLDEIDKVLGLP